MSSQRRRFALLLLFWSTAWLAPMVGEMPFSRMPAELRLPWMADRVADNLVVGIVLCSFVHAAAQRLRGLALVGSVLAMAGLLSLAWAWADSLRLWEQVGLDVPVLPGRRTPLSALANSAWRNLFASGLLLAACLWERHYREAQALLAQVEMARARAATRLAEAQLQMLQAEIRPELLTRALTEVQRRYPLDSAAAERLLDRLTAFLRAAMPGLRRGSSSLAGELALAEQAAMLRAELAPAEPAWHIERPPNLPPELPFPPLLLPLLEALSARAAGPVSLRMRATDAALTLSLHGSTPDALDTALEYRLRVGLQTLHGDAARMSWQGDLLQIHLALDAPIAEGAPPWMTTHETSMTASR